jgi:ParB family chromosome partitioning protein
LLAVDSAKRQEELARRAVREGLSARQLERLAADEKPQRRKRRPKRSDVHDESAVEALTRKLQTRVEIRRRGRGGFLRVHFHSEEELMRLYDLLIGRTGSR